VIPNPGPECNRLVSSSIIPRVKRLSWILGPLQNTPPSTGGGLLLIAGGLCGLVYVSFYLIRGRGKGVSKWKIAFFFLVLLFLTANGIMQLFAVR
jgi:hypothetical protein